MSRPICHNGQLDPQLAQGLAAAAAWQSRLHPRRFWQILSRGFALRRQRQSLARLERAQLEDIGITAAEAARESQRPFWDAPAHWYHSTRNL